MSRQTKHKKIQGKRTEFSSISYDKSKPIWIFTDVDRDGDFAFDVSRIGENSRLVLDKIINYSSMTWGDIRRQTHDDGRSKHHYISAKALSNPALKRLEVKELDDQIDGLFSFAFTNLIRIFGIRDGEKFKVLWYDPKHEVCPSTKKHT